MPKSDHFAVVIGIGLYPGFIDRDLVGPVYDAIDFIKWLRDPAGGALPDNNIRSFPSPQPKGLLPRPTASNSHPNAGEIDALFQPLYERGQYARVGERLYIFVAGHGISDRIDLHSVALLAANCTPSDPSSHVAMVKRAEWFRRHAAFDEIILFADCCRTNVGYELTPLQWPERWSDKAHPRASRVRYLYGFATGYGKVSRERIFGNGVTRGIFSQTLLKSLVEAQPDATGRVTGMCLQNHVHNIHESIAGDVRVEPPDFDSEYAEDIVFSAPSTIAKYDVIVTIQPHTGHDTLVVIQDLNTVERFLSAGSPLTLHLVPGLYKLEIGGTDRHQFIEVPKDHECVL